MDGDGESNYVYFALHKLHIKPSEFMELSRKEKAFIMASIDVKIEKEKEEFKKIKSKK